VLGFPLLTALALEYITSAHSIVFLGMLPLTTAIFGVMRGGERPRPAFWVFSILGSLLVVGFAVAQGLSASPLGNMLMLLAIIVCGLGYAEGAKLSKKMGGAQVISWALVSRVGPGRYSCRWAVTIAATFLWISPGGYFAA
jgi:drug/metabolite transporter (DMT)-like permease